MDTAFHLHEDGRAKFLQILVQTTGCSYVCLWSRLNLPSCLCSLDGFYQQTGNSTQPSSSAGSLAQRLFEAYRKSMFNIDNNHITVPGLAFKTNHPCIELKEEDLLRLATEGAQRHFYQEAKIKKAIFMGCQSGEIELGFSNMFPDDVQTLVRTLFPEDFSRQVSAEALLAIEQQLNPPPSSSSSLRSLSLDGPEYSSLLLNLPGSSLIPDSLKEVSSQTPATMTAPMIAIPQQMQALDALSSILNVQFLTPGSEHEAMTKAFLAVITSPSSSTSSSQQQQQPQQNLPGGSYKANTSNSAFRRYSSALLPVTAWMKPGSRRHDSMMKRAIAYFRHLNQMRVRQTVHAPGPGSRPTSTQLHHVMSERRRREKLNESLQALKALLPPGTKKDKASVLASTRDYLTSLKAQIEGLRQRNAALEAQLPPVKEAIEETSINATESNPINVRVRQTSESTSQDRTVDLQVIVRSECSSKQLVIRILEFLRQLNNVHLMSMDSDTRVADAGAVTQVNLRLRIEGNEWDESAFEEAVRRLVSDVANRPF